MRDNSIHIRESILAQVLYNLSNKYNISKQQTKLLAKDISIACKPFSLSHRKLSIDNAKLLNKAKRTNASGLKGASLFASLLLLYRQKLKHRGVVKLNPGDPEWPQLKVIVQLADQFNIEFGLKEKQGYIEYLKIALGKMQKFGLNKMPNLHASICQEYEAIQKIQMDPTPQETRKAYDYYNWTISEKTGIPNMGYDKVPEKYAIFVQIKNEANKIGISTKHYIAAQFEAFGWRDGVPDPLQMIGQKALLRIPKYCYEHGINLNKAKPFNFKEIKDANNSN